MLTFLAEPLYHIEIQCGLFKNQFHVHVFKSPPTYKVFFFLSLFCCWGFHCSRLTGGCRHSYASSHEHEVTNWELHQGLSECTWTHWHGKVFIMVHDDNVTLTKCGRRSSVQCGLSFSIRSKSLSVCFHNFMKWNESETGWEDNITVLSNINNPEEP